MLKGITKIELTDINTGEVKSVEETNFVTNALKQLCQPMLRNQDTLANAVFYNEGAMSTEALMRGLLLFDSNLGESANTLFPPASAKMIGHGGEITYAGSDISMGSFNTNQSDVASQNERTYVWDFTAEQANGIINSVCLTTQVGGHVGHGSETKPEAAIAPLRPHSNIIKSVLRVLHGSGVALLSRMPVYLSFKDDYILFFDVSKFQEGKLVFSKISLDSNKFDVFSKFANLSNATSGTRAISFAGPPHTLKQTVEITFPSALTKGSYFGMAQDGKYLYITEGASSSEGSEVNAWAAGSVIDIVKINLETLAAETISVTNTTGVTLAMRVQSSAFTSGCYTFGVSNGYLFARSWVTNGGADVSKLYAINLSDNTDVKQVKDAAGKVTLVGVSGSTSSTPFMMTTQGKVCFTGAADKPSMGYDFKVLIGVSTSDFVAKYFGTSSSSLYSVGVLFNPNSQFSRLFPTDNELYFVIEDRNGEYAYEEATFYISVHPNVLMTINNLSTPVEKTPAQTMRITYKIVKE